MERKPEVKGGDLSFPALQRNGPVIIFDENLISRVEEHATSSN